MTDRGLKLALAFTFVAHGVAMLGMLLFLLPMVPGGGGAGGDLDRVVRIATSPATYRLGWLGWQITALSDVVFAAVLFRTRWVPRRLAILQLVFVLLAIIPDQGAQLLLVTRGIEIARESAARHDPSAFLAYEDTMFPLTSAWAAILYTLAGISWAFAFRSGGRWNRLTAWLSPPMYTLYVAISIAPILPRSVRPSAELIGAGNAVAFTLLELWFVGLFAAVHAASNHAATARATT